MLQCYTRCPDLWYNTYKYKHLISMIEAKCEISAVHFSPVTDGLF